jgi:hypothetical protein
MEDQRKSEYAKPFTKPAKMPGKKNRLDTSRMIKSSKLVQIKNDE